MAGLADILSWVLPRKRTNLQSVTIKGNDNRIEQNQYVTVFVSSDDATAQGWLEKPLANAGQPPGSNMELELGETDDSEEIRRITEYRAIATKGDSDTALSLLEGLRNDSRFSSGNAAFRLEFNIGIVHFNIGQTEQASACLRTAHGYCPENKKALAGLAFAEFCEGLDEDAFSRAVALLSDRGDHQLLAAIVTLQAARRLNREFDIDSFDIGEPENPEFVAAKLYYLRESNHDQFNDALNDAYRADPENVAVASMWALRELEDVKKNQAFLLGAKVSEEFEARVAEAARIFRKELEVGLDRRPPNKAQLPLMANNTAVAMRMAGLAPEAATLLDGVIARYPEMLVDLAQMRAVLFLEEDKREQAFEMLAPLKDQADLQIMASEIEAGLENEADALERLNSALVLEMTPSLRLMALSTKARIGINLMDRKSADEAIDDIRATFPDAPELVLIKSAYDRRFAVLASSEKVEDIRLIDRERTAADRILIESLSNSHAWDFLAIMRAGDELLARGFHRECVELLKGKVSLTKESPALQLLAEACLSGGFGTLANEIATNLGPKVRDSVFGWRFVENACHLNGEVAKAVPLARKLFEHNPTSLGALERYAQCILRTGDRARVTRILKAVRDDDMTGKLSEKRQFVSLLVFCGELERARFYAYKLFFENRNDNRAWMALSASILAVDRPATVDDALSMDAVAVDAAFEVEKPNGERQTYVVETDPRLMPLRDENIGPDHPIALAAAGMQAGDTFPWPIGKSRDAKIISVKHKAVDAFHFILRRFEEQFPGKNGFKSVSINPELKNGLDEVKAVLEQRAEYSQSKATEYGEGSYPLAILASHLALDPIDAFSGLFNECGVRLKVSSCSAEEQENAARSLARARDRGLIADPVACYLLRRFDLTEAVEREFGPVGVTQNTIDIFAERLRESENVAFFEDENGERRSGTIAARGGQIVMSENAEQQVAARTQMLRADLEWLKSRCVLVPAIAKSDPQDELLRLRQREEGRFLDDLLAADGSDRILLSEDFHLRQWASGIFGIGGTWMQAMLFHLEKHGQIEREVLVRSTIHLGEVGESALSVNADQIIAAARMVTSGDLDQTGFEATCSFLGQADANMPSHVPVAAAAIIGIWQDAALRTSKMALTGIILRKLVRLQGDDAGYMLGSLKRSIGNAYIRTYIDGWRIGHFIPE